MGVRDLPGVDIEILDGQLGRRVGYATRIAIIGPSAKDFDIVEVPNSADAVDIIGVSPLLDAVLDAFLNGAGRIVVANAKAADGAFGTSQAPTGQYWKIEGATGKTPNLSHLVKLVITKGGGFGAAKYKISTNGGWTYSDERLMPDAASPYIDLDEKGDQKLHIWTDEMNFTEFNAGEWSGIECTAPSGTTDSYLTALDNVLAWRDGQGRGIEGIIILFTNGTLDTQKGFIVDVLSKLHNAWQEQEYPVWAVVNGVKLAIPTLTWENDPIYRFSAEDIDTYVDNQVALMNALRNIAGGYEERVAVNVGYGFMQDWSYWKQPHVRSAIGALAGLIAKAKIHHCIGWVGEYRVAGIMRVEPYGSDSNYMDANRLTKLHEAHAIALRTYPGYGISPVYDWLVCSDDSDFFNIRYRRIMDYAVRAVQQEFTRFINSPGADERAIGVLHSALAKPLDAIKVSEANPDGSIQDYELKLWPDEDILTNGIVHCELAIQPVATKSYLKAKFRLAKKIGG